MYRRYSTYNEGTVPVGQARRNKVKNVIILLLLIALIVMCVVAIPAMRKTNESRTVIINRMQSEMATAVRLTPSLSRSAGASSAAILAQIRSNIYTIETLNELSVAQDGAEGMLLDEEYLASIVSSIDNYITYLTTGMDTGEYQTNLTNTLDEAQAIINALE